MNFTDPHILDFSKSTNTIPSWFIKQEPYNLLIGDGDTPQTIKFLEEYDIFICYPLYDDSGEYLEYLQDNIKVINTTPKYYHKHLICIVNVYDPIQCDNFCILFKIKFNKIVLNRHAESLDYKYINILLINKGSYYLDNSSGIVITNNERLNTLIEDLDKLSIHDINHQQFIGIKVLSSINKINENHIQYLLKKINEYITICPVNINITDDIIKKVMLLENINNKFEKMLNIIGYLLLKFHIILGDDLYGYIELSQKSNKLNIILRFEKDIELKYKNKYLKYKNKYLKYKNELNI